METEEEKDVADVIRAVSSTRRESRTNKQGERKGDQSRRRTLNDEIDHFHDSCGLVSRSGRRSTTTVSRPTASCEQEST